MARRRKMDPERKAFINSLLEHYQPKDAQDIQEMLKDLLGETLQGMLEAEMDDHLGYSKYDYKNKETDDSRNGYSPKTVTSSMGTIDLDIPRDRKGEFEPQIVKKNQTDISNIEDQVLSMYAKGMTTRDISTHLRDVYGVEASAEMISRMTDRILPLAKEWQNRPLERKYAIVFMDAVHFNVREDNRTVKKAVYVAIGIKLNGKREVLGMWIGGNESAKYWLGVLNEIKNRGVEDIMIVSVDGLTGFGDAIHAVFPKAEIQRCIVHQIRYSTKFISYKDLKPFMADLKLVYKADTEDLALSALDDLEAEWGKKYPSSIASWRNNWSQLCQVLIKSLQYKNRFLLSLGKHEHKALRCIYPKCFLRKHERTSFASNKTPSAAYSFSASLIAASMCVVSNMFSYVSMLMTTKSP